MHALGTSPSRNYIEKETCARYPSLQEQLTERKARLQLEMSAVDEALEVLKKNPDMNRLIDVLRSIGM